MVAVRKQPAEVAHAEGEPDKSLRHSVHDGCAHALMLGAGEAYLPPFAVFLGASSLVIALLASLPLLLGSFAQVASVHLLDRLPRRKPVVVWPALVQGLIWLPLLILPLISGRAGPVVLLACAMAYFVTGSFAGPAWNSWIGDLVDPARRGSYFGSRDRVRTLFQICGLIVAGITLKVARDNGEEWAGFAAIFGLSLLARVVSVHHLNRMVEPESRPEDHPRRELFTFIDFMRRTPSSNFGRFSLYVAALQLMTNISGPFFVPYMLRDLQFSYGQFMTSAVTCALAMYLTLGNWGRVADKIGNRNILAITGLSIPILPILWLFTERFELILVIQAVSGLLWAGFNLSVANFMFDAVSPPKRARCVAYYNVLVNSGIFVGAAIGGWLAPRLSADFDLFGLEIHLVSGLQVLMVISGVGRMLVSLLILPRIREERPSVESATAFEVITEVVGAFPLRGWLMSVYTGVHPEEERPIVPRAEKPRVKPSSSDSTSPPA